MTRISILIICAIIASGVASAQRTTRRNLYPKADATVETVATPQLDTLAAPDRSSISVNGYDKPLRSRRETFFATNNSEKDIARLAFTIEYLDAKRRMLHKMSRNVAVAIPAGETRQISVRSWDEQFNFYFHRSAVPQRAQQATPYDIRLSVDTIFFETLRKAQ